MIVARKFKFNFLALLTFILSIGFINTSYASMNNVNMSNPKDVVTAAINNTLLILDKYKGNTSISNTKLRDEVDKDVLSYFNTQYIAGLMLGPFYRDVTPQQFEAFRKAVVSYMVNAYIEGLSFYNGQQVSIANAQIQGEYFASDTVTVYSQTPITVSFKLVKNPRTGDYGIIDFVAEGISFADTKAQEWRAILQSNGIDYLTNYINQHSTNILSGLKNNL